MPSYLRPHTAWVCPFPTESLHADAFFSFSSSNEHSCECSCWFCFFLLNEKIPMNRHAKLVNGECILYRRHDTEATVTQDAEQNVRYHCTL